MLEVCLPGSAADADRHRWVLGRMRVVADRDLVLILGRARAREPRTREDRQWHEQSSRDRRRGSETKALLPAAHRSPLRSCAALIGAITSWPGCRSPWS